MGRDPCALLGAKRSDTDAQVRAAFLRALALHDPAKGGSESASREVKDAYARICADRGIDPAEPSADDVAGASPFRARGNVADAHEAAPPRKRGKAARGRRTKPAAPARAEVSAKDRRVALGPNLNLDLPLAEITRRARAVEAPLVRGRMEQCHADRKLGILWIIAQKSRERGNMPIKDFARFKFRMSYDRLNACAVLAHHWPDFVPAHRWFTSRQAREAGWVAKAPTGAPYAREVMGLHRDFLNGLGPTDREDAAEARREEQAEAKRAAAVDAAAAPEARVLELEAEVARLDEARRRAVGDADWATRGAAEMQRRAEANARHAARWKGVAKRLRADRLSTGAPVVRRRRP